MTDLKQNKTGLLIVLFGMGFIAAFNENTVNVALVYIQADLDVSSVVSQWLVTGYMIVSAIVSAICAFVMHRFRLRSIVFVAGFIFVGGSVAAMFAPNFPVLLIFRLLQAIGTGLYVPVMMTTILKVVPRERMGTFLAVGNMCITLGPALGPALTGIMISFFGWRTIFVPGAIIMTLLLIAAVFFVYNVHETAEDKLDIPSVILASVGLTFFMYGLTQICTNLILSIITLLVGTLVLGLFARRQFSLDLPFLNLSPFSNRFFVISCLMLAVAMMTSFSTTVLLPQYLQDGIGVTAFITGALILLPVMCNAASSVFGGRLFDTRGPFPLLPLGYLLMTIGVAGMALSSRSCLLWPVIISACITFVALGLIYTATQASGLKPLSESEHAHGVSILNVLVMIFGAFGTSLYGGVAQAGTDGALAEGVLFTLAQGIGFSDAMAMGTVFGLIAFALAFFFRKDRQK